MRIVSTVEMKSVKKILEERGLVEHGRVQKYIDKAVIDLSEPYVAGKHLTTNAYMSTDYGSGEVIYGGPDAHYLWQGDLYVDPITGKGAFFKEGFGFWSRPGVQKVKSDRQLEYHGGGLRGKQWVDRMKIDRMNELIAGAEREMKKGGN